MRKYNEIKFAVLHAAKEFGTENKLSNFFSKLEKAIPMTDMFEPDVKAIWSNKCIEYGVYNELHEALAYFNNLPKKRKSEEQTRQGILNHAKYLGIDAFEVNKIFDRYDNLIKSATTDEQRKQIAAMGAAEIHKLLDCTGPLVLDGEVVIDGVEVEKKNTFRRISD
jgi:hypothetical protein